MEGEINKTETKIVNCYNFMIGLYFYKKKNRQITSIPFLNLIVFFQTFVWRAFLLAFK